jgi:hypothetical protein
LLAADDRNHLYTVTCKIIGRLLFANAGVTCFVGWMSEYSGPGQIIGHFDLIDPESQAFPTVLQTVAEMMDSASESGKNG